MFFVVSVSGAYDRDLISDAITWKVLDVAHSLYGQRLELCLLVTLTLNYKVIGNLEKLYFQPIFNIFDVILMYLGSSCG